MSKKIKITEQQLKTIMERRHMYHSETNEQEMEDTDQEMGDEETGEVDEMLGGRNRDMSVTMAIWSHLSDISHDDPKQRQIRANFIKLLVSKFIPDDVKINESKLDNLWDEVSRGDFSGKSLEDGEESEDDMLDFEGTTDSLNNLSNREDGDDEMMNESIKKIKSNFRRFL